MSRTRREYTLRVSRYNEIRQSNCCDRTSAPLPLRIQKLGEVVLVSGKVVPRGPELPHAAPAILAFALRPKGVHRDHAIHRPRVHIASRIPIRIAISNSPSSPQNDVVV